MFERKNVENNHSEMRKIQYSGKSSFTIALPKKWVVKQKLNAGDQLSVYSDNSNNLVLSAEKNSKENFLKKMKYVPKLYQFGTCLYYIQGKSLLWQVCRF